MKTFKQCYEKRFFENLTQAINCCLRQGIFPENAEVASVVPLDKRKSDKYEVLNYRPVSILNAFSKIYEKVIKNQLASYLDIFLLLYQRTEKVTALNRFLFVC